MEDFDVLNLEYLNKLKYQCFVWAEFVSVVDSISPKPISNLYCLEDILSGGYIVWRIYCLEDILFGGYIVWRIYCL